MYFQLLALLFNKIIIREVYAALSLLSAALCWMLIIESLKKKLKVS